MSASDAHQRLALAGRGHHRLDHAGQSEHGHRFAIVLQRVDEAVWRCRQPQRFRGEATDAFAIHGQARGARGRDDPRDAFGFEFHQGLRADGLDLRHDQGGFPECDERADRGAIEHVQHVAAMGDLHRRRIGVAVGGDHLHPEALQLDRHFLAQFARTEQEHAGGVRGQRRADRDRVGSRHAQVPWRGKPEF
jgi:hypothetical protein